MYSNKLYTPLRYPGGKGRFAPFLAEVMRENGLDGGNYLEPYAGGAAVALELLYEGVARRIHINDADPAVYAFWLSATSHPEELLRLLHDTPVTMSEWVRWRDVLTGSVEAGPVEKGFATLFLNRTNRSGILKAGVIGGKEQGGHYKLDARLKKDVLSRRIERIASNASRIHVHCEDAASLLRRCRTLLGPRGFVYLDPPYYVKGKGLYRNFYAHEDHVRIADLIRRPTFKTSWVVSYDNVPEIRAMYRGARATRYGLHYTAQDRYVGREVMFFKDGLRMPRCRPPSTLVA